MPGRLGTGVRRYDELSDHFIESVTMTDKYAQSGVNISNADRAKQLIKGHARSTFTKGVLTDIGLFGGLFQLDGKSNGPVLVSSTDGVGTKLKVAIALDKHDTVGIDIVNHCINDIFTTGADPLFFLDYIALGKLVPEQVETIVKGMALACREPGCARIGGETAEMPGVYAEGNYDIAGFIVGQVARENIIDGTRIREGDALIGVPSSGLHTNGYSLARKVFKLDGKGGRATLEKSYPELGRTLGEALLEPHRCYYRSLKPVLPLINGMAHITGGGLVGNVPRVLPQGLIARVQRRSWQAPPLFKLIQKQGKMDDAEMFLVFNMGVGMVLMCSPDKAQSLLKSVPGSWLLGEIAKRKPGEEAVQIV